MPLQSFLTLVPYFSKVYLNLSSRINFGWTILDILVEQQSNFYNNLQIYCLHTYQCWSKLIGYAWTKITYFQQMKISYKNGMGCFALCTLGKVVFHYATVYRIWDFKIFGKLKNKLIEQNLKKIFTMLYPS